MIDQIRGEGRHQIHQDNVDGFLDELGPFLAKDLEFDKFVNNIVTGKITSAMYRQAGKIYPLKRLEIRKAEVHTG